MDHELLTKIILQSISLLVLENDMHAAQTNQTYAKLNEVGHVSTYWKITKTQLMSNDSSVETKNYCSY